MVLKLRMRGSFLKQALEQSRMEKGKGDEYKRRSWTKKKKN
jgi:hypothetical protein